MSVAQLERTLRDLKRVGTLVKDRGYRQIWRFEQDGKAYYLKFYRRHGFRDRFRRFFRGSPAMAEFTKLQWLQRAQIPAPRAIATLMGYRLGRDQGDAVLLEAIEPAIQLDQHFNQLELHGEPIPNHAKVRQQIIELVKKLAQAGYGHEDLHLGNLLLKGDTLYLLDGYAVRPGGLKLRHLLHLGNSVRRYATRSDLIRGWNDLGPLKRMPMFNPVAAELVKTFIRRRLTSENRYFGRISIQGWKGSFFKHDKYPRRWSRASQLEISNEDWQAALSDLLPKLDSDALQVIKRSRSGDVLAATIHIGREDLPVIIKRPRRRYWYRYINEIGRGSRARRAWFKAWRMILRNFPTAWPLLFLELRSVGYVTDSLIIFERVPGTTFPRTDLESFTASQRDTLFRRTGKILREIEREGFAHFDAKASNWIVRPDEKLGPGPVLIDVDGIRRRRWIAMGIQRLLRSMHENKHYSPADSYSLCRGYAPTAPLRMEKPSDGEASLASDQSGREDQSAQATPGMDADANVTLPHDDRQQTG